MWYFLIGFVPFINPLRAFPLPSFWQDVSAFILLMAWVAFASRQKFSVVRFSLSFYCGALAVTSLIALIVIQQFLEITQSSHYALLVILVLLGGLLVHFTARDLVGDKASLQKVLVPWSCGVVLALLTNVAAAQLARHEMEWALFRFVSSTPLPRDGGFFGQPNQYGVFCLLALLALHYLYAIGRVRASIYNCANIIGFLSVAMSGSRAAIVVWLAVSGAEYWLNARKDHLKLRDWMVRQFLFIFCQVAYVLYLKYYVAADVLSSALRTGIGPRAEQWRDALLLIREHPVFGVGLGNFASTRFFELSGSMLEPESTHTHNIFSHLLAEFGVGAVLVLIPIVILVKEGYFGNFKKNQGSAEVVLLGGWCLGLFLYSNFEYPLWYISFLYTFLFISGLSVGCRKKVKNEEYVSSIFMLRRVGAALMLAVGIFASYDYWRLQGNLLQTVEYLEGRPTRDIKVSDVMLIRSKTLFVDQLDELWIDISDPNDGAASVKFPIVERLFAKTPSVGGAALYIYYALAVGQEGKAAWVLRRLSSSNALMGQRLRFYLDNSAKKDLVLAKFLMQYDLAN